MSNKFEKLLDYLVNEEMDKANELFHEIVVEKSREIYSDLISEEMEEDEDVEEGRDEEEDEEEMEEGYMEDEGYMYEVGNDDDKGPFGGDASDDFLDDVEDHDAMGDDDDAMSDVDDAMGDDEPATKGDVMDIKDDLAELKAEFEALLAQEKDEQEHMGDIDDFDDDGDLDVSDDEDEEEFDDEESDDEEETDESFMREYRETIDKNPLKGKGEVAGVNTRSPVSSAKGRPTTGADAKNLAQDSRGADPKAGAAGLVKKSGGEFTKGVTTNIDGKTTGVKKLSKVSAGHGSEKKGAGEKSVNDRPILKNIK
jgi:hypothetical protein